MRSVWNTLSLLFAIALVVLSGGIETWADPGNCCSPTFELWCGENDVPGTKSGDAFAKSGYMCPSFLHDGGRARAWLDTGDGFASKFHYGAAVMILKTSTCSGWSYKWQADGKLYGSMTAKAKAASFASGYGWESAAAKLSEDLTIFDADTAVASSSSGASLNVNVGSSGPGAGIGWAPTSASAAFEADTGSLNGSQVNHGPGHEVQVKFTGKKEVKVSATTISFGWAPHNLKSWGLGTGYAGAGVILKIFCSGGGGITYVVEWDVSRGKFRTGAANGNKNTDPEDINWDPWQPADPDEPGSEPPSNPHPTGPGWEDVP